MTVIVGLKDNKNNVYMGADSVISFGDTTINTSAADKKIICRNGYIFGITGYSRIATILRSSNFTEFEDFVPDSDGKVYSDIGTLYEFMTVVFVEQLREVFHKRGYSTIDNNAENFVGSILVYHAGGLFSIGAAYSVLEVDDYFSIGCGGNLALGSLATTKNIEKIKPMDRIRLALRAAEKHNAHCGSPFYTVECNKLLKKSGA